MKSEFQFILAVISTFIIVIFNSCDEYLDQTPDAVISDQDIFGSYHTSQGFVDKQYVFIWDIMSHRQGSYMGFGDDFLANLPIAVTRMARGQYDRLAMQPDYYSPFYIEGSDLANNQFRKDPPKTAWGRWPSGWEMIRDANLVLKNVHLMTDATQEERNLIEGQVLFFRAYHYYTYVKNWGGMPYIDKFLEGNDDPYLPRLNTWETIEKISTDCERAAALLPDDWNNTAVGATVWDKNVGRITKGACYGLQAKALLCAGSPTFVLESTGDLKYDYDYMRRCATAAWEIIKLANTGVHSLVPWEDYYKQFGRNDGFSPWSSETLIACVNWVKGGFRGLGGNAFYQQHGGNISPMRFGGNAQTSCLTQNVVEMFEMANGLPVDDPDSGYDPMDPWSNRDPRLRGSILFDGDEWTFADPEENRLDMYIGGKDNTNEIVSPFLLKKYWPKGVNDYDKQWNLYTMSSPNLRLAEVYLIYAEAVNEVWGPNGTLPGASLTAIEAVNKVRERAGMPPVASKFLGSKETFRDRIWNERAVELIGEDGVRWYDLRRWHVAHLDKYKICYKVEFDKEHTYFNKLVAYEKVFEQKHYWLPVPLAATQVYSGFYQNPGW